MIEISNIPYTKRKIVFAGDGVMRYKVKKYETGNILRIKNH